MGRVDSAGAARCGSSGARTWARGREPSTPRRRRASTSSVTRSLPFFEATACRERDLSGQPRHEASIVGISATEVAVCTANATSTTPTRRGPGRCAPYRPGRAIGAFGSNGAGFNEPSQSRGSADLRFACLSGTARVVIVSEGELGSSKRESWALPSAFFRRVVAGDLATRPGDLGDEMQSFCEMRV